MFGAGWTEMLIIGIVALVVIGPKDLPIVMRKVGRVVGTIRRMGSEFQREINKTTGLDQITDLRRSITEPLRQTSEDIAKEFNRMTPTGVEPSGIMTPLDPKIESVYEQIAATSGVTTPAPVAASAPSMVPAEAAVLPGPAEAAVNAPQVKARRVTKPKTDNAPAAPAKVATKRSAKVPSSSAGASVPTSPTSAPAKTPARKPSAPAANADASRKSAAAKGAGATPASVAAAAPAAPAKTARSRAKKA